MRSQSVKQRASRKHQSRRLQYDRLASAEPAVEGGEGILVESGCSVGVQRAIRHSLLGVRFLLEVATGDNSSAARFSRSALAGCSVVGDVVVPTDVVDVDSLGGNARAGERRRQRRAMRGVGKHFPKRGMGVLERRVGDEDAETVGERGLGVACR